MYTSVNFKDNYVFSLSVGASQTKAEAWNVCTYLRVIICELDSRFGGNVGIYILVDGGGW